MSTNVVKRVENFACFCRISVLIGGFIFAFFSGHFWYVLAGYGIGLLCSFFGVLESAAKGNIILKEQNHD